MLTHPDGQTRGEANCNPGNIDRHDGTIWMGQSPDQSGDARFVCFGKPEYGIRALAKTLLTYFNTHRLNTVQKIVNRWAPPNENDTRAYVNHVAAQVKVLPDTVIDVTRRDTLRALVTAIIQHENGRCDYSDEIINKGVQLALP